MQNTDFINGAIIEYYQDAESAQAGKPALTEEVYARRNPDMESWTVYRLRAEPGLFQIEALPEPVTLSAFFNDAAAPLFHLPEIIASHVGYEDAVRLVRENETRPTLGRKDFVHLIRPPQDLDWTLPSHKP